MINSFVRKLASFENLSGDEIAALEKATAFPRRMTAHHDLIREGDKPGPVFVVLEG